VYRYPYILIDKTEKIRIEGATCVKNVATNERYFDGHYPGNPVMPGVLIVEALAQVCGEFMKRKFKKIDQNSMLSGIDKLRFRRPVRPGDVLRLQVELLNIKYNKARLKGTAFIGEKVAASGYFMVSILRV